MDREDQRRSGSAGARAAMSESTEMRLQRLEREGQPWLHRVLLGLGLGRDARFLLLVLLAGLTGGLAAIVLRTSMGWLQALAFGAAGDVYSVGQAAGTLRRLLAPTIGCLLAGVVLAVAARRLRSAGGGVATLMEAVAIRTGVIPVAGVLVRSTASLFAMAGGASVGREGPIIALSSASASWLGRSSGLESQRLRLLVASGAAAGFAAAYNTPVAGVLFVLEVIVGAFAVEVLGPVALASAIGALLARWSLFGGRPLYEVPVFEWHGVAELPAYVVLGLACAAGGALFLEALEWGERLLGRLRPPAARTAVGGLVVGAIAAAGVVEVYGNGYEVTSRVLEGQLAAHALALIFVCKIVATTATVGAGVPGGVFTPTLLLGASLGASLGNGLNWVLPGGAEPGAYALVGMGAMLSATTHAPLLAVVFIFEVSRDYAILLPLLLACIVATLAARSLRPRSIYAQELGRRGIAWEQPPEARVLESLRVRDVMRALSDRPGAALPPEAGHVTLVSPDRPAADALRRWEEAGGGSVYVVDADRRLLGEIGPEQERRSVRAGTWRRANALAIAREVQPLHPGDSLRSAIERLWHEEPEQLPIVDEQGRLLGVLSRRDVLGVLDTELLRRNVMLAKLRWRSDAGEVTDFFELPSGYRLEQLPVPDRLVGKSLREAGLDRDRGVVVLAVLRRGSDGSVERFVPRGADRFAPADVLVVLAKEDALRRILSDR